MVSRGMKLCGEQIMSWAGRVVRMGETSSVTAFWLSSFKGTDLLRRWGDD